jgi:hypothetical protein
VKLAFDQLVTRRQDGGGVALDRSLRISCRFPELVGSQPDMLVNWGAPEVTITLVILSLSAIAPCTADDALLNQM